MYLTFIHQLQEDIIDATMSLLYLIEENYRVRPLTDLAHKKTSLFVAHIARRSTVEQSSCMLFLKLRHIEAYHRPLIIEKELS